MVILCDEYFHFVLLNKPLCHDSIIENHWHSFTMIIKSIFFSSEEFSNKESHPRRPHVSKNGQSKLEGTNCNVKQRSNPNIYGTIFHLSQSGHVLHILWNICRHHLLLSGSHHGDRNNQSNYWTSVMDCTSLLQKFTGSQNAMRRMSSGLIWINANLISLRWRSVPPAGTHQKSCKSFWKTFVLSFNVQTVRPRF